MPREKLRFYEFQPEPHANYDYARALVCLAFATRSTGILPETAHWALRMINLEALPRDVATAARMLRAPRYERTRDLVLMVPDYELVNPLVTGMRLLLDRERRTASIAEHNRIAWLLEYVAPFIERHLPERLAALHQLCQYYQYTPYETNCY